VFVALGDGNDEVTVPAQTVSFLAKISESDGNNRMRLTHTAAGVDSNGGDTIAFGPGSSGTVNIWGAGTTVYAVDGGAEYIYCSYAGLQPKLRLDVFDSTNGQCGTDVLPPQTP
jgi:hypothetical protein